MKITNKDFDVPLQSVICFCAGELLKQASQDEVAYYPLLIMLDRFNKYMNTEYSIEDHQWFTAHMIFWKERRGKVGFGYAVQRRIPDSARGLTTLLHGFNDGGYRDKFDPDYSIISDKHKRHFGLPPNLTFEMKGVPKDLVNPDINQASHIALHAVYQDIEQKTPENPELVISRLWAQPFFYKPEDAPRLMKADFVDDPALGIHVPTNIREKRLSPRLSVGDG